MTSYLDINIQQQSLSLLNAGQCLQKFPISTAKNGAGEANGSGKTPRGQHQIRIKIGDHAPINSVFVGRRLTGEIYSAKLAAQYPHRDWILTRILWLGGCESGYNRGKQCDSLHRYIYIHGTPDTEPMGLPLSHGCIRMTNTDMITLFNQVTPYMRVNIHEY